MREEPHGRSTARYRGTCAFPSCRNAAQGVDGAPFSLSRIADGITHGKYTKARSFYVNSLEPDLPVVSVEVRSFHFVSCSMIFTAHHLSRYSYHL